MRDNWQNKYSRLTEFMSRHVEISITQNLTKIPTPVRDEFYRLFDDVRKTFIEQSLPMFLAEGNMLSQNISQSKSGVIKLLNLENITLPPRLDTFVESPIDSLVREIFDPLFELLKDSIDYTQFANIGSRRISDSFIELFPRGFEKWIELTILSLIQADKLFQFVEQEVSMYDEHRAQGVLKEEVPIPKESTQLTFRDRPDTAFMVPDYVVHSKLLNKFISLRGDINQPLANAVDASENREWLTLESLSNVWPTLRFDGIMFLFLSNQPADISLVADKKRICRPDIVIECKALGDWQLDGSIEEIKLHHNTLKPRIGTFIISRHYTNNKDWIIDKFSSDKNLYYIETSFDKAGLEPIINALIPLGSNSPSLTADQVK